MGSAWRSGGWAHHRRDRWGSLNATQRRLAQRLTEAVDRIASQRQQGNPGPARAPGGCRAGVPLLALAGDPVDGLHQALGEPALGGVERSPP
ncbi:MAG: hypothetical protein ACK41W_12220, partial [Cyanobacteriota bacterium]